MKVLPILIIASILAVTTSGYTIKSLKRNPENREVNTEELLLTPSTPPFNLGNNGAKFYKDIKYGLSSETILDFYIPESSKPTPLVIFIHGGGFTQGDKKAAKGNADLVASLLAKNIAFVSINYTLLAIGNTKGILEPLNDSKRALQFIRYHAKQFNINKEKVILMGGSAGAGTSLWIAFNDNMADKNSSDPVLRESTRVNGVIAISTQATYNISNWANAVFKEYEAKGFSQNTVNQIIGKERVLSSAGFPIIGDLNSPAFKAYGAKMDMLALMSNDDPEIYVTNSTVPYKIPNTSGELNHHPLQAKALLDEAKKKNVKARVSIPQMGIDTQNGESKLDFIIRLIGK